jgi:hypothetical protein
MLTVKAGDIRDLVVIVRKAVEDALPPELSPFLVFTNKSTRKVFKFSAHIRFGTHEMEVLLSGGSKGNALEIFGWKDLRPLLTSFSLTTDVDPFIQDVVKQRLPRLLRRFHVNKPFFNIPTVSAHRETDGGEIKVFIDDLSEESFGRLVKALPEILGLPSGVVLPLTRGTTAWDRLQDGLDENDHPNGVGSSHELHRNVHV